MEWNAICFDACFMRQALFFGKIADGQRIPGPNFNFSYWLLNVPPKYRELVSAAAETISTDLPPDKDEAIERFICDMLSWLVVMERMGHFPDLSQWQQLHSSLKRPIHK